MKISVIVPSNKNKEINEFCKSYSKLTEFKKHAELIVIGNGEVKSAYCDKFIRYEKDFDIIPFVELRGLGMLNSDSNFFLFLDDDHRFKNGADRFLMECISFLEEDNMCGVLQLDKKRSIKDWFEIKNDGYIWTSRGLFIKNTHMDIEHLFSLKGACEDLLYAYETLVYGWIPYKINQPFIIRDESKPNNDKELNDKSYSKEVLDENIVGFINHHFSDPSWEFYGHLYNLRYPIDVRDVILKTINKQMRKEFK